LPSGRQFSDNPRPEKLPFQAKTEANRSHDSGMAGIAAVPLAGDLYISKI
jgi:hypothetical protein